MWQMFAVSRAEGFSPMIVFLLGRLQRTQPPVVVWITIHMPRFWNQVLYASSWLLTAFSADFPLFFSARVMDVILSDCYDGPIMKARALCMHSGSLQRGVEACLAACHA